MSRRAFWKVRPYRKAFRGRDFLKIQFFQQIFVFKKNVLLFVAKSFYLTEPSCPECRRSTIVDIQGGQIPTKQDFASENRKTSLLTLYPNEDTTTVQLHIHLSLAKCNGTGASERRSYRCYREDSAGRERFS